MQPSIGWDLYLFIKEIPRKFPFFIYYLLDAISLAALQQPFVSSEMIIKYKIYNKSNCRSKNIIYMLDCLVWFLCLMAYQPLSVI